MTLVIIVGPPAVGKMAVGLEATQTERLRRNDTPLRLAEKRPQRDVEGSRAFILEAEKTYRMNTGEQFFYPDRHLRIDNTTLEPEVVARQIAAHFSLRLASERRE